MMIEPFVEFGDLPERQRKGNFGSSQRWQAVADGLRQRPWAWACVYRSNDVKPGGMATNIKNAKYVAFRPAGTFEATARGTEVWARFVGVADGQVAS